MQKAHMATLAESIHGFFTAHPEVLLSIFFFFFFFSLRHHRKGETTHLNWPVLGCVPYALIVFFSRLHDAVTLDLRKRGGSFALKGPWFTNMEMVITCDPATVKYITTTNFTNYPKGESFNEIFEILGDGIFNVDGDAWSFQRKIAQNLISHQRFQQFSLTVNRDKLESGFLPLLQHFARRGEVVDLQDVLQRFNLDIMCLLLFNFDLGSLSIDFPVIPFAKAVEEAQDVILFRHVLPTSWWKLMRWLRVGKEKKLVEAWKIVDDFIDQLILSGREKMNNMEKKNNCEELNHEEEEPIDLLTSYLNYESSYETGREKLSHKFLRDTMLTFLAAGNTTAVALAWFFFEITRNPAVEAKILDEIHELVLSKEEVKAQMKNNLFVFETKDLKDCVYLHAALNEALRLYPGVPLNHKSPLEPDVLPTGHVVNPSTQIILSFYAMARMDEVWGKDCMEFKPERWITEQGTLKIEKNYKFPAFHVGPRTCLGKPLALTLMKSVAASVLYHFRLRAVEGHRVYPKMAVALHMKHGLMVRVEERQH